jgi:hypothetical protein
MGQEICFEEGIVSIRPTFSVVVVVVGVED